MSFTLARWFQRPVDANRPEDDFIRETVLMDLEHATAVGKQGATLAVRAPNGVCLMTRNRPATGLVEFDYVADGRWARTVFWMNESSVADLAKRLTTLPEKPFDDVFAFGAEQ